jgi:Holliday junction resolvasome RuvABC endonuclease subunit
MTENIEQLKDIYLGLDLSSTNTGLVALTEDGTIVKHALISPNKALNFEERVVETIKTISNIVEEFTDSNKYQTLRVAIEGGALYGKGKRNELAMLNGAVYYMFLLRGVDTILVPPSRLKKFATGSGRASKGEMLEALPKLTSSSFQRTYKKYDDVVDAYWLATYRLTN